MITKEQILKIADEELTPIGWGENTAKRIDGLNEFADKIVKICNISHVSKCKECGKEYKSLSI